MRSFGGEGKDPLSWNGGTEGWQTGYVMESILWR